VDDRLTPGLYLELTNLTADDYAPRAKEVLANPGVDRLTLWENAHPNRKDLPPELPEFSLLAVYETELDPVAFAPVPEGVNGHAFRRTARPGQGLLSDRPTQGLLLVLVTPRRPEEAQALRDWADFIHIRHIAAVAVPGYTMITPYERVGGGDPRFLHFYEMDTDDPEAAFSSMTPRVMERLGGGFGTPAFDEWAGHPALRIMYVNTFRLIDAQAGD
jgi:hypothetical protein